METKIGDNIAVAVDLLRNNQLVAIPTETVYGLAGNGISHNAIFAIFEAKNRPFFDPLILHFDRISAIEPFVQDFHPLLKKLAVHFWPGPLTVLLPRSEKVPDLITSGLDRVAVRIPNHPITLALLHQLDFPLAAPSANPFGYISPTTAAHVFAQLNGKIPYILDGGSTSIGLESTIIGEENGQIIIYRLGGTAIEKIEEIVGKVIINTNKSSNPTAPGMLKSHYAPRKPLRLFHTIAELETIIPKNEKSAVMTFAAEYKSPNSKSYILSINRDDKEAAKNLFAVLREMDNSDATHLFAQLLPENGLGLAINDRLQRAAV